ncbi:unnamed protein product [Caenorhabditis brenneri]
MSGLQTQLDYFATPDFLSLASHVISGVSTPIHFIGLYFLLFKTPEQMKSVKWYLVMLHLWIVLFDYVFSLLTIPFFLFPAIAFIPLGLLNSIGVPAVIQTVLTVITLGYVLISLCSVFENRFHTICMFSWKPHWTKWRRVWLRTHYIVTVVIFVPFLFFVPEQTSARQAVFQNLPCLPNYLHNTPVFVITQTDITVIIVVIIFLVFVGSEDILFILLIIFNTFQQIRKKTMSRTTYKMQRTFFIALLIQSLVPLLLFVIPSFYALYSVFFKYYNQIASNFLIIAVSMHGFSATLVMLLVHPPYRNELVGLLTCSKRGKRKMSIVENLKHRDSIFVMISKI